MPKHKSASYCCSYPKSGRTWLRFILAHYLNRAFRLGLDIDFHTLFQLLPNHGLDPRRGLPIYRYHHRRDLPLIIFDHGNFEPRFTRYRSIVLFRSVYDTLVSHFFHLSRRSQSYHGSLSQFIRDPRVGLASWMRYVNGWVGHFDRDGHLAITYESLHHSPGDTAARVLDFLGLVVDQAILDDAVAASSFERLQGLERCRGFPNPSLRYDASDVQALRAREGSIGGYRRHLTKDDIAYVRNTCAAELTREVQLFWGRLGLEL